MTAVAHPCLKYYLPGQSGRESECKVRTAFVADEVVAKSMNRPSIPPEIAEVAPTPRSELASDLYDKVHFKSLGGILEAEAAQFSLEKPGRTRERLDLYA